MQDSTAEQQERLRPRMASMASHEVTMKHVMHDAAIASLRRGSFSSQSLTCVTSHARTFALFDMPFGFICTPSAMALVYESRSAVMAMPSAAVARAASRGY